MNCDVGEVTERLENELWQWHYSVIVDKTSSSNHRLGNAVSLQQEIA